MFTTYYTTKKRYIGAWLFLLVFVMACRKNQEEALHQWIQQADTSQVATIFQEGALPVVNPQALKSSLQQKEMRMKALLKIDTSGFTDTRKSEWLRSFRTLEKQLSQLRQCRFDPSSYNLGAFIQRSLSKGNLHNNIGLIEQQLNAAPEYYASACKALDDESLDLQKARLGAQKQMLTLQLLKGALRDSLAKLQVSPVKYQDLNAAIDKAETAVKDYLAFCNKVYFKERKLQVTGRG